MCSPTPDGLENVTLWWFLSGGFRYFLCFPCLGKSSHLTIELLSSIFQTGWSHQLAIPLVFVFEVFIPYYFSLETLDGKKYQLQQFCARIDHVQQKMCCFLFSAILATEGVNKKAAGRITTTNCSVAKVKIMVWDHNRDGMLERASVGIHSVFFDMIFYGPLFFIWAINV